MDKQLSRSIDLFILCLTVLVILLLSDVILTYVLCPSGLFATGAGQTLLLYIFAFSIGVVFYIVYLTRKENIVTLEEREKDPREDNIDLDLPYNQTFDICKQSIYSLTGGEVRASDENKGIIEGWAYNLRHHLGSTITIKIQEVGGGKTHVDIRVITPHPSLFYRGFMLFRYPSPNEQYVKRIHNFLQENLK